MSDRIFAQLAALQAAEEEFAHVLTALRVVLEDLDRSLASGLAEWNGDARAAYRDAHAKWRTAADDMANRLDALKTLIGTGHHNYRRSLAANMAMWRDG